MELGPALVCDGDSLEGDNDSLNLCKASKLSLNHSLVYCNPSRLFSTIINNK